MGGTYPPDREVVCYRPIPLADAAAELAGTSRPKWGDVEAPILPLSYRSTAPIFRSTVNLTALP